jgi:hypothetical protein
MIQWRNFNIDPDWYLGKIDVVEPGEMLGRKTIDGIIKRRISAFEIRILQPTDRAYKGRL